MGDDKSEFWLVWNPEGRNPHYRHPTAKAAADEAERLAGMNPTKSFYVLHAIELRRTADAPVEATTLQPRPPDPFDDECPF